ncbi:MAG: PLP-dependent aminotransferase family protein [Desulfurococcaceae archaeon]
MRGINYYRFMSSRVNYVEPSPIREMVAKIAARSKISQVISFAAGDPDPDVIPRELYGEIMNRLFKEVRNIVVYSPTDGVPGLKDDIARYMERYEGVNTSSDNIIVTLGGSQAIDLVGRIFLDPGDIVFMENPSYVNTILVWRQYGAMIIGIPIDDHGMRTDVLEDIAKKLKNSGKKLKLIYTIPTGQNPSGISMSIDRRKHLLEIANEHDLLIVEDGAYNLLVYEPIELRTIRSMDSYGRVIYVGSFSKILGTGLRIGWIESPTEISDKIRTAKGPTDMCPPVPSQYLVMELLRNNILEEIRQRAIMEYREKRDIMLSSIEKYLGGLKHTRPVAGMFILLWLPMGMDAHSFSEILLEKYNVAVIPATPFYTDGSGKNVIRLNFSQAKKTLIEEGIKRISILLKEMAK